MTDGHDTSAATLDRRSIVRALGGDGPTWMPESGAAAERDDRRHGETND